MSTRLTLVRCASVAAIVTVLAGLRGASQTLEGAADNTALSEQSTPLAFEPLPCDPPNVTCFRTYTKAKLLSCSQVIPTGAQYSGTYKCNFVHTCVDQCGETVISFSGSFQYSALFNGPCPAATVADCGANDPNPAE